jgi:hypothetical protein
MQGILVEDVLEVRRYLLFLMMLGEFRDSVGMHAALLY